MPSDNVMRLVVRDHFIDDELLADLWEVTLYCLGRDDRRPMIVTQKAARRSLMPLSERQRQGAASLWGRLSCRGVDSRLVGGRRPVCP